ncbi:hypothetical protein PIB30_015329 [Stylosanthes scabra]|uniref:F-box domain-containing protein n=1 Tax=Stylosanthes scabra TaxID=79078 RepID=A0ABU6Q7M2_9FABA|nr:hypothetical protein [Stylosanthes scabra]
MMSSHHPGWMDLPMELLELILQRVTLMDNLMNCRATCRSWRKVAEAVFSSQLPLMLSLSPSMYVLSAPWSYHDSSVVTETWTHITNWRDEIIRLHSVQGWLMFNEFHTVILKNQIFSELCFYNPFSRASFKLPWLLFSFLRSPMKTYCQVRVVFNSAPPGSEEFIVVLLCVFRYDRKDGHDEQMRQKLAFFKFKHGSWIVSESIVEYNEIFYDIAVDDDDKLYGLTFEHETSVVFVITLSDDDHVVKQRLVMQNSIEDIINFKASVLFGNSFYRSHRLAMDTSTGELLLVLHYVNSKNEYRKSIYTKGFRVFKLERSSVRWCEVFDIGDRFLLWDSTIRVSFVSAKGLTLSVPDKFKRGNCIFFIKKDDMGVFFLGDRTINHFPVSSSLPYSSFQKMWFSPAP